jgi:hypothetical protein
MAEEQKPDNEPVEPGKSDGGPGTPGKTKTRIHLSHDGLFKAAFDNKHLTKSFTRKNLPAVITKDVKSASRGKSKY